jgi:hypothetical protein
LFFIQLQLIMKNKIQNYKIKRASFYHCEWIFYNFIKIIYLLNLQALKKWLKKLGQIWVAMPKWTVYCKEM